MFPDPLPYKTHCRDCKEKSCAAAVLDPGELDQVNENSREAEFRKGDIIIHEGSLNSNIIYLKSGLVKEYVKASNEKEDSIPPLGNAHVRELCNPSAWAMAAALSQPEREAQKDVGWGADGTLCAMNGFASWLAEKFPRVSLDAGLAIVATNIGEARQRMPAIQVKDRIINKFAYLESDEIGRDRRATARMQAAPPGGPPPAEHWRDKAAEKSRRISEALQRAAANFATEQACAV